MLTVFLMLLGEFLFLFLVGCLILMGVFKILSMQVWEAAVWFLALYTLFHVLML